MTTDEGGSVSDLVAERIREIRRQRGLKAPDLAARCAELGAPDLSAQVIFNIENRRRRSVTIDEFVTLARALDVPLVMLLQRPVCRSLQVEDVTDVSR